MDTTTGRKSHRRGNYSMLMGLTAITIVGFAAFAVDLSLITMAELQAQATADAASHAALVAFREELSTAAGNDAAAFIVAENEVALGNAVIDVDTIGRVTPLYGQWDFTTQAFLPGLTPGTGNANAVEVAVSRVGGNTVELLLAPILGITTHDVRAEAITAQQQRAIMLIQDMSCSMMTSIENDTNSAVEISRLANRVFLQFITTRPQDGDLLGLAIFSQAAGNPPAGAHPWGGGPVPWLPLQLVEANDVILERIDGICDTTVGDIGDPCLITNVPSPHCHDNAVLGPCRFNDGADIGGCTNPEPALLQAINELNTSADDGFFRGIVFMSDGIPNCDEGGFDEEGAIDRANDAADIAQANGISIWTILFHNGSFDPEFMGCDPTDSNGDGTPDNRGLTRGIGFCQSSPNASDLPNMYRQVAESLPTAFVN